jgi:hypothetical protein
MTAGRELEPGPTRKVSRRHFLGLLACGTPAVALAAPSRALRRNTTINVKDLGAFGNGKLPDVTQIREAIRRAGERTGGTTIFFPPGDYYLGAADDAVLLDASGLRNVRFVGERATLSCRSVNGQSSMLRLAGCREVVVEGLRFRDHGLNRNIEWLGAAGIRLANEGVTGCESIQIRDCGFDSVLTAVVCRRDEERPLTRCRDIALTNLSVTRSYYGFSFQDNGDNVVARGLRCTDVKRSYFPYGISDHDIELDTSNNATGFTDVLIKCYHGDTARISAKVRCRGKRGGDAIVALDQQHEKGRGTIRDITLNLDVDDADCALDAVILIRSFTPSARYEAHTQNRWDNVAIDGDVKLCVRTKLIDVATTGARRGILRIGPKLATNPRLPRSFPGFNVVGI